METESKEICRTCGYFRQHYIWRETNFMVINNGHCVHPPRVRQCRPKTAACLKWIPQDEAYRLRYAPKV